MARGTATSRSRYQQSNGSSSRSSDPATLLARGFTSRFLGAGLPITPLSSEEIDKDLHHIEAWSGAVKRYQQQHYADVNGVSAAELEQQPGGYAQQQRQHPHIAHHHPPPHHHHGHHRHHLHMLPVRIDPEEEKRMQLQRKKIAKAERQREEVEQHYVALRAHYVQACKDLKEARQTVGGHSQLLQNSVADLAAVTALQRCRVQMTRDCLAALQHRNRLLEQQAAADDDKEQKQGHAVMTDAAACAAPQQQENDPLSRIWNQVEEDLRAAVTRTNAQQQQQQQQGGSSAAGQKKSGGRSGSGNNNIMPWPCTKLPATVPDVPLLVSTASTAPEKSIAWSANGMFGSSKNDMVWLEQHLPDDSEEIGESVQGLRQEVAVLERELNSERSQNQTLIGEICQVRRAHDEWVSMMSLVRQETESVLHRHNILLESEPAVAASERLYELRAAQEEEEAAAREQEAAAQALMEHAVGGLQDDARDDSAAGGAGGDLSPIPEASDRGGRDDANDGDDEGSNNDEESQEGGDWNHHNASKRAATDDNEGLSPSRKRRRL